MSTLIVESDGCTQVWTLNRPLVRNALDEALVDQLGEALDAARTADIRVVILRGTGPSFCAGADLRQFSDMKADGRSPVPFLRKISQLTVEIEHSDLIFIAALHGHAVAGGLELALACDVVVAEAGTVIGDGHLRRALLPGGGASVRLRAKLGAAIASWLALSGELVPVEQLDRSGWVHRVVPSGGALAAARGLARVLVASDRAAQVAYKQLLRANWPIPTASFDRELAFFEHNWLTGEVESGLAAFLSASPPPGDHDSAEARS
ncbi:putative 2,3-dehydroadipyl-CoA hydratase [metagenome]|uniref:Putative 2,3-dehydroadipyl-CoA hydratase n=1 Tax=metagenome TaxID=256318 RepID=A0A2P2C3V1_9ZZZZ